MKAEHPSPRLFERYLRALGVGARPPGLEALQKLTAAHLHRVPFETSTSRPTSPAVLWRAST